MRRLKWMKGWKGGALLLFFLLSLLVFHGTILKGLLWVHGLSRGFRLHVGAIRVSRQGVSLQKIHLLTLDGAEIAEAREMKVSLAFLSLFSRDRSPIPSLEIFEPRIHLHRTKDGVWNVSSLFRKTLRKRVVRAAARPPLVGKVSISGGGIFLVDEFWKVQGKSSFAGGIEEINGQVDLFRRPGKVSLSGIPISGGALKLNGTLSSAVLLGSGVVRGEGLSLESWGNYLLHSDLVAIRSGRGELTLYLNFPLQGQKELRQKESPEDRPAPVDVVGTLSVHGGVLDIKGVGLPLTGMRGDLDLATNSLTIRGLHGFAGSSPVKVGGEIRLAGEPDLSLSFSLPTLSRHDLHAGVPWLPLLRGSFSASCLLSGPVSNLNLSGRLEGKEIGLQSFRFDRGSTSFRWLFSRDLLILPSLDLSLSGGDLAASGWISSLSTTKSLAVLVDATIPLSALKLGGGWKSTVSFALVGTVEDPLAIGKGSALTERASAFGVRGVTFPFAFDRSGGWVRDGEVLFASGKGRSDGYWTGGKEGTIRFRLRGKEVEVAPQVGKSQVRGDLWGRRSESTALDGGFSVSVQAREKSALMEGIWRSSPTRRPGNLAGVSALRKKGEGGWGGILLGTYQLDRWPLGGLPFPGGFAPGHALSSPAPAVPSPLKPRQAVRRQWETEPITASSLASGLADSLLPSDGTLSCTGFVSFVGRQPYLEGIGRFSGRRKGAGSFSDGVQGRFFFSAGKDELLLPSFSLSGKDLLLLGTGRVTKQGVEGRVVAAPLLLPSRLLPGWPAGSWGPAISFQKERAGANSRAKPVADQGRLWLSGSLSGAFSSPAFTGVALLESGGGMVHAEGSFSPHEIQASSLTYLSGRTLVSASGGIRFHEGRPEGRLALSVSEGELSWLSPLFSNLSRLQQPRLWRPRLRRDLRDLRDLRHLSGKVWGRGELDFASNHAMHPLRFSGSFFSRSLSLEGYSIDTARGSFQLENGSLLLPELELTRGDSLVSVQGKMNRGGGLDLAWSAPRLRFSDLAPLLGLLPGGRALAAETGYLSGIGEGSGEIRGEVSDPLVVGRARFRDLSVFHLKGLSGEGSWRYSRNALTVQSLHLQKGREEGWVKGEVSLSSRHLLEKKRESSGMTGLAISLRGVQISTLLPLVEEVLSPQGLEKEADRRGKLTGKGVVDGHFTISGKPDEMTGKGSFTFQGGDLGGIPVDRAKAEIAYMKGRVKITSLEATRGEAILLSHGVIDLSGRSNLNADLRNFPLSELHKALHLPLPVEGIGDSSFSVTGEKNDLQLLSSFEVRDGKIGHLEVDRIRGIFVIEKGMGILEDLRLVKGRHQGSVKGKLPLLTSGGWNESSPLHLQIGAPLDLTISLKEQDLALLALFFPSLEEAAGKLNAQVTVTGSLEDPLLGGEIQVMDGTLPLPFLKTRPSRLYSTIELSGRRVKITRGEGALGGGKVTFGGEMELGSLDGKSFPLRSVSCLFSLKDLLLEGKSFGTLRASGDLVLSGEEKNLTLSGTVSIPQGKIRFPYGVSPEESISRIDLDVGARRPNAEPKVLVPPLAAPPLAALPAAAPPLAAPPSAGSSRSARSATLPSAAPPSAGSSRSTTPSFVGTSLPMGLSIRLLVGDRVSVSHPYLDLNLGGELTLKGTLQSPFLEGALSSRQGTLSFLNTTFRIDQASATFQRDDGTVPEVLLEASATRPIDDTRVFLTFTGLASRPRIQLHSEPPLDERDILGLLARRKSLEKFMAGQEVRGVLQEEAMRWASAAFESRFLTFFERAIETTFGLDLFAFEFLPTGQFGLTVGKSVARQLYVSYTLPFSTSRQPIRRSIEYLWGIEYRVTPGTSLKFSLDSENAFVYGIQARFLF